VTPAISLPPPQSDRPIEAFDGAGGAAGAGFDFDRAPLRQQKKTQCRTKSDSSAEKYQSDPAGRTKPRMRIASTIGTEINSMERDP